MLPYKAQDYKAQSKFILMPHTVQIEVEKLSNRTHSCDLEDILPLKQVLAKNWKSVLHERLNIF